MTAITTHVIPGYTIRVPNGTSAVRNLPVNGIFLDETDQNPHPSSIVN